jgi:putative alpha-1,2-mannosidase
MDLNMDSQAILRFKLMEPVLSFLPSSAYSVMMMALKRYKAFLVSSLLWTSGHGSQPTTSNPGSITKSAINYVNPLIGTTGDTPNGSGGMIPSVAPPFGMTRWVAQTHENFVSRTPYNSSDNDVIHGFIGTHQPAIWMGESGQVVVVPGFGEDVKNNFSERGLKKIEESETFGVGGYEVSLEGEDGGSVRVEMTASMF